MALLNNEQLIARIRSNYILVNDHWIFEKYSNGYGKIYAQGKNWNAHRLAYEVFVGPIPDGLHLDHLCRITNCANPAHLEPVTPAENNRRGNSIAALNSRKTHCLRGHPLSGDNLRYYGTNTTRQCRACHAMREAKRRARRIAL